MPCRDNVISRLADAFTDALTVDPSGIVTGGITDQRQATPPPPLRLGLCRHTLHLGNDEGEREAPWLLAPNMVLHRIPQGNMSTGISCCLSMDDDVDCAAADVTIFQA